MQPYSTFTIHLLYMYIAEYNESVFMGELQFLLLR